MWVAIAEYRFLGLSPVEKMSGTYVGDYADGRETFHLNRDGTFSQQFVRYGKTIYVNHGHWDINKYGDENEQWLSFTHLMMPLNIMAPMDKGKGVTQYPIFICNIDDNEGVIVFNEDQHIYVNK